MSSTDESAGDDRVDAPVVRRGRGSTTMSAIQARRESQKKRLHVEFDANMNVIGPEEDSFISYLGYLARNKVSILYSHWKLVPQKTKELIWAQILQTYDVPNTKAMNKHWMGEVRLRWKDFKNKLTKKYVRGERMNEDPCQKYSFISPEDWKAFVASRQHPDFLEISQANKERQAANKYPHCMSRGGYKKLERKMMEEELEKMKEAAQSDPSIIVQAPDRPPRHKKWKAARMKGGKYINPDVAEVAAKIDALEEQSSQGSFTPGERMDILSTAIGKPDYRDHIRGETRGVSAAKYFGRLSRCTHDDANPSPQLVAKIRASLFDEIMQQVRGEVRSMIESKENPARTTDTTPAFPSSKESVNPATVDLGDPSHTPTGGVSCTLHLDVPHRRIVADALVFTDQTTHHNNKIPEDQRRVTVKSVREGEDKTDIPIEDEEVPDLGRAIGSFILWPNHLIEMATTPLILDAQSAARFPYLAQLGELYKDINYISLEMRAGIVGADKSYPITIDKKDLEQFMSMDCLDIGFLQLAIIVCHNICVEKGLTGTYGFLCPANTTSHGNKLGRRTVYVGSTIADEELPCYLSPILEGGHWTLCVVCPSKNMCYWLDPIGGRPNDEIKSMFAKGLATFRMLSGAREQGQPKWSYPKCPRQPGNSECGYFVVLYMHSIVCSGRTVGFQHLFDTLDPYSEEDIDTIRDLLSGHLLQCM